MTDVLVGAATMAVLGVLACLLTRDGRAALAELAGAIAVVLASPVVVLAEAIRWTGLAGARPLDPRALQAFARMKYRGGGQAFVLTYARRWGVIFVRMLRDNEPVPPVRVRSTGE